MTFSTFRYIVWSRVLKDFTTSNNRWVPAAQHRGINTLTGLFEARIFFVQGSLDETAARRLADRLLVDPVTEAYSFSSDSVSPESPPWQADHFIDVSLLPGVTDTVADNLQQAAQHLDITHIETVASGQRFYLQGDLQQSDLHTLAAMFANPVIQRHSIDQPITAPFVEYQASSDHVEWIAVRECDDDELLAISAERRLALDLDEMRAIQSYFRETGRDPSDAELEMLAQTWSEHCIHKTFRANIRYSGPLPAAAPDSETVAQDISGLLKQYIRAATEQIDKPWIRSAFVDDAGIIAFDEHFDLAFKVETHNHPSAIEPFGGANTGVGGVVRDVLGVSARPIANTDILCFGPLETESVPDGALHPRQIAEGVVHGIEDYGNKMGIPTVNGAVLYHEGYTANPLVYCGCLGLLPTGSHPTGAQPGDLIVVLGGRTGRDGLRGATFSSMEMDATTGEVAGSAVQIGNPIQEKQVLEVILRARDAGCYHAITDCGAGGLSSAVGEMAEETGAAVQLATVPLKYPGLTPWEIWLSEAQERMVMAVPPEQWDALQHIAASQDVEATCIGEFNATGRLTLHYDETLVGDLSLHFLHEGIPTRQLDAVWTMPDTSPQHSTRVDIADTLLKLLAHPNIASKEAVIRRYDHEVQGGTVVKPLSGVENHGPSDAAVLAPQNAQPAGKTGAVLSNGICPQFTEHDPYAMAWAAIDEAIRNAVAVGADPDKIAILDNFCWGNPNLPDRLGSLVRCVQGCYDAAIAYGTPFISGKDSLNNEYADSSGQRHAIPGTLLISAVGIIHDIRKAVTMDLKEAGNALYLVGETRDELGGSQFNSVHGLSGGTVPQPKPNARQIMWALHQAMQDELVESCHDLSEGGLAVALAEMCIAGRLGAAVDLSASDTLNSTLFSESLSRFIVEVAPENEVAFKLALDDCEYALLGHVTESASLTIQTPGETINLSLNDLEKAWRGETPGALHQDTAAATSRQAQPLTQSSGQPRTLILHANGSNRDHEAALACELAGAAPEIVHVNQLLSGQRNLLDYHMLVVPGGFSYGDDLGAGVLWALDLQQRLFDSMRDFVAQGRPVLGICNGFQALVKAGLLPGGEGDRRVTLTYNERAQFECRWVYLQANVENSSPFLTDLDDLIYCPVAHGEGRIAVRDEAALDAIQGNIALTYVNADGSAADYPGNPNGSTANIAALSNTAGNVLGLMPHPENHIFDWQHPRWRRGAQGHSGLRLFENAVNFARQS